MELGHLFIRSVPQRLEFLWSPLVSSACWSVIFYNSTQYITVRSVYMLKPISFVFLYFVQNSSYI